MHLPPWELEKVAGWLLALFSQKAAGWGDVFVLVPSLKTASVGKLENELVQNDVGVYVAPSDDS